MGAGAGINRYAPMAAERMTTGRRLFIAIDRIDLGIPTSTHWSAFLSHHFSRPNAKKWMRKVGEMERIIPDYFNPGKRNVQVSGSLVDTTS